MKSKTESVFSCIIIDILIMLPVLISFSLQDVTFLQPFSNISCSVDYFMLTLLVLYLLDHRNCCCLLNVVVSPLWMCRLIYCGTHCFDSDIECGKLPPEYKKIYMYKLIANVMRSNLLRRNILYKWKRWKTNLHFTNPTIYNFIAT